MSKSDPIRVFVADDHAIVRKGIAAVLEIVPDIEVVGEAENGRDAVRQVEALQPDVILMDLVMPEMDGIEAIRRIKERQPGARILVLTTFAGEDQILPAIKAGALGYHLKDSRPQELAQAIRQVHRGESSLHPVIARKVLEELSRPSSRPPTPDPLPWVSPPGNLLRLPATSAAELTALATPRRIKVSAPGGDAEAAVSALVHVTAAGRCDRFVALELPGGLGQWLSAYLATWRLEPARRGGAPVDAWVIYTGRVLLQLSSLQSVSARTLTDRSYDPLAVADERTE